MNTTSQFTSNLRNIYIAVIVLLKLYRFGLAAAVSKCCQTSEEGEEVQTTGHKWDGIARIRQSAAPLVVLAVCFDVAVRHQLFGYVSRCRRLQRSAEMDQP